MSDLSPRMRRILIIHDEPGEGETLGQILRRENFLVHVTEDPLEGLHQTIESPPDLVLAALEMEQLSGDELCVHLRSRKETKEVPVVLLSARSGAEGREIARFSGAIDHVQTPVGTEPLLRAVRKAVGAREPEAPSALSGW